MRLGSRWLWAGFLVIAATQLGCHHRGYARGAVEGAGPEGDGQQQPAGEPADAVDPEDAAEEAIPSDPEGNDDAASTDDFSEPLAGYGTWVDAGPYGRAWRPSPEVAGTDFQPYASDGQWEDTDDGWVFRSKYDEEWGWATYHYGRWAATPDYGWVWIPGVQWAPSWVEWRYGGGNVGWAPMAPAGVVYGPERWVFVEQRNFVSVGVYSYRFPADRVVVAYGAAPPIVEVHGRARWYVGPSAVVLRSSGVAVRHVAYHRPGRGYVKMHSARVVRARAEGRPVSRGNAGRGPGREAARRDERPGRRDEGRREEKPARREEGRHDEQAAHKEEKASPKEDKPAHKEEKPVAHKDEKPAKAEPPKKPAKAEPPKKPVKAEPAKPPAKKKK